MNFTDTLIIPTLISAYTSGDGGGGGGGSSGLINNWNRSGNSWRFAAAATTATNTAAIVTTKGTTAAIAASDNLIFGHTFEQLNNNITNRNGSGNNGNNNYQSNLYVKYGESGGESGGDIVYHNYTFLVAASSLLGVLIVLTIVGNVFVIAAIILERNLRTSGNYLVLSLAVADLMVASLVMPLGAFSEIAQQWTFGTFLCDLWTSADVLCSSASILHLLAIALDRYWAVTYVDYIHKRTPKRIGVMIFTVWTVAAIVSIAPLFGWKDPDFITRVELEKRCLISQDIGYQLFATISTFYGPLIFILLLYWKIYQVARKRIRHKPGKSVRPVSEVKPKIINLGNEKSLTSGGGKRRFLMPNKTTTICANINTEKCQNLNEFHPHPNHRDNRTSPISGEISNIPLQKNNNLDRVLHRVPNDNDMDAQQDRVNVNRDNESHYNHHHNRNEEKSPESINVSLDATQLLALATANVDNFRSTITIENDYKCDDKMNDQSNLKLIEQRQSKDSLVIENNGDSDAIHNVIAERETATILMNGTDVESHPNMVHIYRQPPCPSAKSLPIGEAHNSNKNHKSICYDIVVEDNTNTKSESDESCANSSPTAPMTPLAGGTPSKNIESYQISSSPASVSSSNYHLHLSKIHQQKQQQQQQQLQRVNDLQLPEARPKQKSINQSIKKNIKESIESKRERKAAKILAIITGIFVICWLPFFVIALLMPLCKICEPSKLIFSIFLWLGYLNSLLNPIIYTIFSPDFRNGFRRILCGRKR